MPPASRSSPPQSFSYWCFGDALDSAYVWLFLTSVMRVYRSIASEPGAIRSRAKVPTSASAPRRSPSHAAVQAALVLLSTCLGGAPEAAARVYRINVDVPEKVVQRGHLELGGSNPQGDTLSVNSYYLEWNGRPFIPVVGEVHFSRLPPEEWEEALRRMKAGGINVVATYVFWNLHERAEGQFDWTGRLDLRRFVELCEKIDLRCIVRIGPFCHGEIRNGGLPDWLYGREFEVRSDDPGYLHCVERLYGEIGRQLRGRLFRDGGPVIGVQLENEYQHSAAPWELTYPGAPRELTVARRDAAVTRHQIIIEETRNAHAVEGRGHMATLKALAKRHGLDVPLYTATGWGNAAIVERGSVPVTAGYAYPFWAPPTPSPFYLYKDIHRHPDYSPVSFEPELYPSIPAELGAGISLTYRRRTTVPPESLAPLIVRTLGSGSNGIGYYMYHGGSTPVLDGKFFHESLGGLPMINYDYQAPIGEFGQVRLHHATLKLLHLFLASYGERLAPMISVLPETNASLQPQDVTTLRYAVRTREGRGFVFLHNFQDHVELQTLSDVSLEVQRRDETVRFPMEGTLEVRPGVSAILPFGLSLADGLNLISATVQPLTVLRRGGETHHVFVSLPGLSPEFVFDGSPNFQLSGVQQARIGGRTVLRGPNDAVFSARSGQQHIVVLPYELALTVLRVNDRLVFAPAELAETTGGIELVSRGSAGLKLHTYPATDDAARFTGGSVQPATSDHAGLSAWTVNFPETKPDVRWEQIGERKVRLRIGAGLAGLHDVFVNVRYVGDRVMAFRRGELVGDHFFYGQSWELGLRRWADPKESRELLLLFHPMRPDAGYLQDLPEKVRPEFASAKETHLTIEDPEIVPVYRGVLNLTPKENAR